MRLNKKVDAYTLSEMLVVLIISSIVISLTFVALNMVQKQVLSIQKNFQNQQEVQSLERALWSDFNTHTIFYNSKSNTLKFTSYKDTLTYYFKNNFILREKDSFPIDITTKKLFLDGIVIKDGYIDAIGLETKQSYTNKKLFVYKEKDALFYLNQ